MFFLKYVQITSDNAFFQFRQTLEAQPLITGPGSGSRVWLVILRQEMRSHAPSRPAQSARAAIPVVTLNIGGRNTNPLEFILEGDTSELGEQVVQMNRRAQEAMVDAAYGPAAMPHTERALVNKILTAIYGQSR